MKNKFSSINALLICVVRGAANKEMLAMKAESSHYEETDWIVESRDFVSQCDWRKTMDATYNNGFKTSPPNSSSNNKITSQTTAATTFSVNNYI